MVFYKNKEMVMQSNLDAVRIYRLTMKSKLDNFRSSATQGSIRRLKDDTFADCRVIKDFKEFSNESDVIIANRFESTLEPVKDKIYTRDIFFRD